MHLKIIACEVFLREFCYFAAQSKDIIDLQFQPFGLHDTPDELRQQLQQHIDETDKYDYIILGYGLCCRGTIEITARATPIIIPRAHDCITIFLGSKQRYDEQFQVYPGTYYYTSGWIERCAGQFITQGTIAEAEREELKRRFEQYKAKYGEDNARYLIEQENQWVKNYSRAAFINLGFGNIQYYRQFTQEIAASRGWQYEELKGDTRLIENLINGNWQEGEILKVAPRQKIVESYDNRIIKAQPLS